MAEVGLVANDGWIMGGTGNPLPDPGYLNSVEGLYLSQTRLCSLVSRHSTRTATKV